MNEIFLFFSSFCPSIDSEILALKYRINLRFSLDGSLCPVGAVKPPF